MRRSEWHPQQWQPAKQAVLRGPDGFKKVKHFTETTTRIQRSKLEKIRGNAEDPACPPDLVGFGAVPFETEPHRVTEYAKLPAHTVFPVGQIFSFASRKFQYLHRSTSYPAQKYNLQVYGSARASGQLNNAGRKLCSACILTTLMRKLCSACILTTLMRKLCSACILTTLIMTWRSWSAKAELWGAKLSDYAKLSPRKQKPESLCLISRKCTP